MLERTSIRRLTALAIALAAAAALTSSAHAAPGDFDTSFDGDGKLATSFGNTATRGTDRGDAIEPAPGGGYYVAGRSTGSTLLVARYEADGDIDPTFGGGDGIASIVQPTGFREINLSVDSTGRPVIAAGDADASFFLARFTTAGVLDGTFGGDGIATVGFGAGQFAEATAVTHLPDGRIAVAGSSNLPGEDDDAQDFAVAVLDTNGTPDPAFGPGGPEGDGRVLTDMGTTEDEADGIAVAPGPSLVVVGRGDSPELADRSNFEIAKYEADGDLDATFSGDGKLSVDLSGPTSNSDSANAVTVEGSSIFVAGQAGSNCNSDQGVIKVDSAGVLDGGFSGDGKAILDVPVPLGCSSDRAYDVDVDSSGNVVLAGTTGEQNHAGRMLITRLTPAGNLDNTLGGTGFQPIDVGDGDDEALGLLVDIPSGTIIAAGTSQAENNQNPNIALARALAATGSPDTSFGGDGIVETEISVESDSSETARSVVQQPDGKLLVAGPTNTAPLDVNRGDFDFGVARYNPDGSLDSSFGGDGLASSNFTGGTGGPGSDDDANAVALQPDGKVVVAGFTETDIAVARYEADGDLDPTFGPGGPDGDGLVTTDLGGAQGEEANAVLTQGTPGQPDFRIVVAGRKTENNLSDGRFALAGYDEAGALDPGFGTAGITTTKAGPAGNADEAFDIAAQPDGNLLVSGETFNSGSGNNGDFALVRYTPDGDLDPAFAPGGAGGNGIQLADFDGGFDAGRGVALRDLGGGVLRIVVAGTATVDSSSAPALAAFTADGSPDATFSPGGGDGDGRLHIPLLVSSPLTAVAMDGAGLVYATGSMTSSSDRFGALRVTAAGALDTTFGGGDGVVNRTEPNASGADLLLQQDGRLMVVGGDQVPQNGSDFVVDRYTTDADPVVTPPVNPPAIPGPDTVKPTKPKCKKKKAKKGKKPKGCGKKKPKKKK